MNDQAELDFQVRRHVYDVAMQRGYPPSVVDLTAALGIQPGQTQAALERLAAGRALVLQPGTGEILMANPFSAVPTPFLVELPVFSCFGNCIWDALGIPAMLTQDARIRTACGDCGLALDLRVTAGQMQADGGVIHFAIPARHWWDDIVFT